MLASAAPIEKSIILCILFGIPELSEREPCGT